MNTLTMQQVNTLATIFAYDVVIDGDNHTADVFMDGLYLYRVRLG